MSKLFLISTLLFSLITTSVIGQENKKPTIYGNFGVSVGNYVAADVGFTYVLKENIPLKFGFTALGSSSVEKPSDFEDASFNSRSNSLTDRHLIPFVTSGYILNINSNQTFKIRVDGGLGLQFREFATNFTSKNNTTVSGTQTFGGFNFTFREGANYNYTKENDTSLVIIINPEFQFLPNKKHGLTFSFLGVINNIKNFYGVGMRYVLGNL